MKYVIALKDSGTDEILCDFISVWYSGGTDCDYHYRDHSGRNNCNHSNPDWEYNSSIQCSDCVSMQRADVRQALDTRKPLAGLSFFTLGLQTS